MTYLGVVYAFIGLLFATFMWLNFAVHCKKYVRVAIFAVIIAFTWPYIFMALVIGGVGSLIEHLLTKKEPFLAKIFLVPYIIMLDKMYQSLYPPRGDHFVEATAE